ncbi:MAG: hypothetical protein GWN84_03285, partial [Gammaproteobacteria bacterium]|nr:hypothetical protein [Gammaproteobacteria bacterium]NIR28350.1 hypothetical protein [Gammaproteobacteria bacterium]NIR82117.1 hypothetical protein [Gammaproteobacteria bacterium]NIU03235.1 hypothetical protein [Gammaproteobacteria bacterium]NIV50724.1 hypothetical protein [Gammaproteobacteria bacterium]
AERFADIHEGMLWIREIPNFEWVYLHCGADHEDTAGCPLLGDMQKQNVTQEGAV